MLRTVVITAGMTMEFEVLRTDAPDEIIVKQLKENSHKQEVGEEIKNPYSSMVENGYHVTVLGDQDSLSKSEIEADAEFDYFDV